MKSIQKLALIVLIVIFPSMGWAQSEAAVEAILKGKKLVSDGLDNWDLDTILRSRALFERLIQEKDVSKYAHYFVAYTDYRISLIYGQEDSKKAVEYLDDAIKHLNSATKSDKQFAEGFALLSSCLGQKIGYSPLSAMVLGPKSGQIMSKALKLAPDNPRVVLLDAISKYYTPKMFGGGKDKAMVGFQKSEELFKAWKAENSIQPDWGKDEVYAWIGLAHLDREEPIKAKEAFDQALAINPNYGWVKNVLLPQVSKEE